MPSDFKITYESISSTVATMDDYSATAIEAIRDLQVMVQNMMTSGGGLWLRQSSPVLEAKYTAFSGQLTTSIGNIKTFAEQFREIAKNLETMDKDLSAALNKQG